MPATAAGIVGQIAAPVVAALLEDVHTFASAGYERLAKAMPPRLEAADQDVQDWAHDAHDFIQHVMARLDSARGNLTAATEPGPTAAETATSTGTSAPTTAPTAANTTATKPTPAADTTEAAK